MIERIHLEDVAAVTKAEGTWDPNHNAVAFDRAKYTSDTADGLYSDHAAQDVADRVDEMATPQEPNR